MNLFLGCQTEVGPRFVGRSKGGSDEGLVREELSRVGHSIDGPVGPTLGIKDCARSRSESQDKIGGDDMEAGT